MIYTKEEIIKHICGVEAGYVNHPKDPGKETNHGITQATALEWKQLWSKHGWNGDMRTLPVSLAMDIYDQGWWQRLGCDRVFKLSPALCERLMDFGVNAGRGNAAKSLQRVLNTMNKNGALWPDVVADGAIGPKTLDVVERCLKYSDENLSNVEFAMFGMQTYYYIEISEKRGDNEAFTNGWLNRVRRDCRRYWENYFA